MAGCEAHATDLRRDARPRRAGARCCYRLGRQAASGVLTLAPRRCRRARRGVRAAPRRRRCSRDGELARRALVARLARLVALERVAVGVRGRRRRVSAGRAAPGRARRLGAHAPRAAARRLARRALVARARRHRGCRCGPSSRPSRSTRPIAGCSPRWRSRAGSIRSGRSRARRGSACSRSCTSCAASTRSTSRASSPSAARRHARSIRAAPPRARLLGVDDAADVETVKRAYRRLARALHPDLQPDADDAAPAHARAPVRRGHRRVRSAAVVTGE